MKLLKLMKRLLAFILCATLVSAQSGILAPILQGSAAGATISVAFNNTNIPVSVSGTSYSHAFSVTAGGSNVVAFAVITAIGTPSLTISSVTYGGNTMTSCGAAQGAGAGGASVVQVFALVNPPTGSNTLTFTGSAGTGSAIANIVSFTGALQSGCPVRSGTYQGTNCTGGSCGTISLTITSNVNDLTLSLVVAGNNFPTISSTNQTSDGILNSGVEAMGSDHATTAAASVTHTWTLSTALALPAMVGFSIQHA